MCIEKYVTYLEAKYTMKFAGLLLQIIVIRARNPLKRAPIRWNNIRSLSKTSLEIARIYYEGEKERERGRVELDLERVMV